MQAREKITVVLVMVGLVIFSFCGFANAQTPIPSVPITITTPGSYCFTGDLQCNAPDSNAIVVDVNDVTIDLMGYNLIGPGSGKGRGIYINARANVEIRNGTIRDFGAEGILALWTPAPEDFSRYGYCHRVIDVRVLFNGSVGIHLDGVQNFIKDCSASGNGGDGFRAFGCSTLIGNTADENGGSGILVMNSATVIDNTLCGNGLDGITAFSACTVSRNTAAYNILDGITAYDGCTLTDNVAYSNAWGIFVGNDGNLIKSNTLRYNTLEGISVDGVSNSIEENLMTDSPIGLNFLKAVNFYANNRASNNGTNYAGTSGQTNGGGNASF
jgi:parallel beta-helix repeat protein